MMKVSKSLLVIFASAALATPITAAQPDNTDQPENGESSSLATEVADLDTPKEKYEKALELGAMPDEYGLIEFDEPIDEHVVGGEVIPVYGIIDPEHVDLDKVDEYVETSVENTATGDFEPLSQVTCTDNPSYSWGLASGANMCFVHPGHNFGQSSTFSVSRVCTNLQGVMARTWYSYGPDEIPTPSPFRTGTGCWDFTGNVPAHWAEMQIM